MDLALKQDLAWKYIIQMSLYYRKKDKKLVRYNSWEQEFLSIISSVKYHYR